METLHIVKIGGNVIDDAAKLAAFLKDFARLSGAKLLVHGGGKVATEVSQALGITAQLVDGRRITSAGTLKVVTMVYGGLINKNIVAQLQAHRCNAIGLTGADANSVPATKRPIGTIDYGFVGDIEPAQINAALLQGLLQAGLTPVFAPLTHDGAGNLLNTNADTIAAGLAVALASFYAVRLVYCFEKKGVLQDVRDEDSVIPEISPAEYTQLKAAGTIAQGMIPKLDNALQALQNGVEAVVIAPADAVLALAAEPPPGTWLRL